MKSIFPLFAVLFFVSCSKRETSNVIKPTSKNENIVLIFGKRSFKRDTIFFNHGKSYSLKRDPILSYVDSYPFEKKQLTSNNSKENDTLIIATKKQILLEHRYHYFYTSTYLLKAGDTIEFTYKNDAPYAKITNNVDLTEELNFETSYNLANNIYVSNVQFREKHNRNRTKKELDEYYNSLKSNRVKQLTELDILYTNGNFDKEYYNLLKTKLTYAINILTDFEDIKKEEVELKNDSLLAISTYKHFLNGYIFQKLQIPIIKKRGFQMYDYKVGFDSILKNDGFSKKIKNYLLYSSLQEIANYYPLDDFQKYYKKFIETVKDTILLQNINNTYLTDFIKLKEETNNVYLVNSKKEKITLLELINQHKGKVVYIDFWASWCTPCRAAMPAAKKLRRIYENDDFVYIYVSIDNDFSKWQNASKEENLKYLQNNFLAINYPKATFYRELQLKSIPKYIVYDTEGRMFSKDAPSPKDTEVLDFINKTLSKSNN